MAHLPGLPAHRYGIRGFGPKSRSHTPPDRPDVHHGLCRQFPIYCRSMLAGGASAPAIITTTFVVNLRHVLMSSALAVYLRAAHRGLLALYAYGVTDESFAVNLPRFNARAWSLNRALVVNHAANLTWFISTVAGGIGGRFIPEGALGIDYALIAMFICLLIYQIRNRFHLLTAVIAGLTAVGLALMIPGNTYIVIASIAAATVGVIIQRKVIPKSCN